MEINKSYYTRLAETVIISPEWKDRWARLISVVFSPLTVAIAAVAIAGLAIKDESALVWIALYIALSILPPALYIMYLVRKGMVTDFHLNVRKERTKPFLIMTINSAVVFLVMLLAGAPELILIVIAAAVLQLSCMLLITHRWKISGHCTAATGLVVLALALFGEKLIPLTLIIPLIAWSRIRLSRHTFTQTVAGIFLGTITITALLYVTNYL
ncbi:MAG: phosphatase PAP2 family protein [Deltaproteobacteria bacterium]|nr:phosphatase PAP2 family protein [Deltaproteobacteria bacterium]MCK5710064.1 phosphatase PAP2 family protein [Deltaproteobacteria bacterium]